jgi:D-alanyl-D-alanine carboxypeptidase
MNRLSVLSLIAFSSLFLVACTAMNEDKTEVNDEVTVDVATPKYDYLVLVNKQHKLPEDWEANVELVEVQNAYDETIKVEKEALEKYNELRDALLKEGVDIELDSAYRSVSKQEEVWKNFEEEKGLEYTQKYVAVP